MILVDSSVWIDHFRSAVPLLQELIIERNVMSHPFVVGELAMGSIRDREIAIRSLSRLPRALVMDDDDVLALIARLKIYARGLGYIDAHLLASTRSTPAASIWTRDRRVQAVAEELGVAADLPGAALQ
jgi:predicted nucleic acid-binding protein